MQVNPGFDSRQKAVRPAAYPPIRGDDETVDIEGLGFELGKHEDQWLVVGEHSKFSGRQLRSQATLARLLQTRRQAARR